MNITPWKRKDFEVIGRFTKSRLAGHENEFIYKIFWKGKDLNRQFTNKKRANQFISELIKIQHEAIEQLKGEQQ